MHKHYMLYTQVSILSEFLPEEGDCSPEIDPVSCLITPSTTLTLAASPTNKALKWVSHLKLWKKFPHKGQHSVSFLRWTLTARLLSSVVLV